MGALIGPLPGVLGSLVVREATRLGISSIASINVAPEGLLSSVGTSPWAAPTFCNESYYFLFPLVTIIIQNDTGLERWRKSIVMGFHMSEPFVGSR